MKLTLTDDLVLIEPLSRPTITNAGIELPEPAQQAEPRYGEVVEVGPGRWAENGLRFEPCVKPGDRVFYNVMNCHPLMYEGKGHFLVREHAIFAVITEDAFREETLISKQPSRLECPEHGSSLPKCVLMEAVHDGRRGVYCPTSKKFYGEKDFCEAGELNKILSDKTPSIPSEYKCPEHGMKCGLRYGVCDGEKGGFCPTSEKFYPEEELKGE